MLKISLPNGIVVEALPEDAIKFCQGWNAQAATCPSEIGVEQLSRAIKETEKFLDKKPNQAKSRNYANTWNQLNDGAKKLVTALVSAYPRALGTKEVSTRAKIEPKTLTGALSNIRASVGNSFAAAFSIRQLGHLKGSLYGLTEEGFAGFKAVAQAAGK